MKVTKITMKKARVQLVFIAFGAMLLASCKDFLNVVPMDRLTGNNFYLSRDDVEANIANMYADFFDKLNESHVIGATGEYRSGEVMASPSTSSNYSRRQVVEVLGRNDLLTAIHVSTYEYYNLHRITNWTKYYQVIQSANILIDKLEEGIPGLTEAETNRYIAEATFMRCFTYFWMVRLYGDVVYYTEPYQTESLPREPMVSVLNKCIADMKSQQDHLPWTFSDPALRGARASRGSAVALLMHMNMWNAGFDRSNSTSYYEDAARLGNELIASSAYRLLPMSEWELVIKGRSEESLFEFYRSINYSDVIENVASFADHFLRWPFKFPRFDARVSYAHFITPYMQQIYPEDVTDRRKESIYEGGWFEDIYAGEGQDAGQFMVSKFAYNTYASGQEDRNPDNTFMIFRYAGVLLLHAEALAELGREDEAIASLNQVRQRAEAPNYSGQGGQHLLDFIYLERCRELIGEGHRYFDLVRTRRILDPQWVVSPLNLDQFNRRAWTWPIDQGALRNNPFMTLNAYWLSGGG